MRKTMGHLRFNKLSIEPSKVHEKEQWCLTALDDSKLEYLDKSTLLTKKACFSRKPYNQSLSKNLNPLS